MYFSVDSLKSSTVSTKFPTLLVTLPRAPRLKVFYALCFSAVFIILEYYSSVITPEDFNVSAYLEASLNFSLAYQLDFIFSEILAFTAPTKMVFPAAPKRTATAPLPPPPRTAKRPL